MITDDLVETAYRAYKVYCRERLNRLLNAPRPAGDPKFCYSDLGPWETTCCSMHYRDGRLYLYKRKILGVDAACMTFSSSGNLVFCNLDYLIPSATGPLSIDGAYKEILCPVLEEEARLEYAKSVFDKDLQRMYGGTSC